MYLLLMVVLRALFWPLFVWRDVGFYLRHALFRKPNMGTARDQRIFGTLFTLTMALMIVGAGLWLTVKRFFPADPTMLSALAGIIYILVLVISLLLNKQRHFAFNEKRWQFSYMAAFFSGYLIMVEYQLIGLIMPDAQLTAARNYVIIALISAVYGAVATKHRPKDMSKIQRKAM